MPFGVGENAPLLFFFSEQEEHKEKEENRPDQLKWTVYI